MTSPKVRYEHNEYPLAGVGWPVCAEVLGVCYVYCVSGNCSRLPFNRWDLSDGPILKVTGTAR